MPSPKDFKIPTIHSIRCYEFVLFILIFFYEYYPFFSISHIVVDVLPSALVVKQFFCMHHNFLNHIFIINDSLVTGTYARISVRFSSFCNVGLSIRAFYNDNDLISFYPPRYRRRFPSMSLLVALISISFLSFVLLGLEFGI